MSTKFLPLAAALATALAVGLPMPPAIAKRLLSPRNPKSMAPTFTCFVLMSRAVGTTSR